MTVYSTKQHSAKVSSQDVAVSILGQFKVKIKLNLSGLRGSGPLSSQLVTAMATVPPTKIPYVLSYVIFQCVIVRSSSLQIQISLLVYDYSTLSNVISDRI